MYNNSYPNARVKAMLQTVEAKCSISTWGIIVHMLENQNYKYKIHQWQTA
jgi:hypothetical protein